MPCMSTPEVLLVAMTAAVTTTAGTMLYQEFQPVLRETVLHWRQTGDTLCSRAVNWIGALAFLGALLICFS
jgi:hypothetical protein